MRHNHCAPRNLQNIFHNWTFKGLQCDKASITLHCTVNASHVRLTNEQRIKPQHATSGRLVPRLICLNAKRQQTRDGHTMHGRASLTSINTPLNLCSVCGDLGLACLDKIHIGHAFRGCVKSDNTLDFRITALELAFSRRYKSKISCIILLLIKDYLRANTTRKYEFSRS